MADRRNSGYPRKPRDFYETPEWVTRELTKHVDLPLNIWEPACGNGAMSRVLIQQGYDGTATDSEPGPASGGSKSDFLVDAWLGTIRTPAVVTNPPFQAAQAFVERAIEATRTVQGMVCMLLPSDWDHAAKRRHLFRDCPQFAGRVVLTKRIRWFEGSAEDKGKQPMGNHCWFIWDWSHAGRPWVAYMAPEPKAPRTRKKAAQRAPAPASDMAEAIF